MSKVKVIPGTLFYRLSTRSIWTITFLDKTSTYAEAIDTAGARLRFMCTWFYIQVEQGHIKLVK